jgi:hypothetical protein
MTATLSIKIYGTNMAANAATFRLVVKLARLGLLGDLLGEGRSGACDTRHLRTKTETKITL